MMFKKGILFLLLLLFFKITIAQDKPKLIIGIVADQMRYDYLSKYGDQYGSDGFNRFFDKGFSMNDHHFNYLPTFTGPGHAAIYTGSVPGVNGIIGNSWFSIKKNDKLYCVEDNEVRPIGTESEAAKRSPANLLTTTIGDQLLFHQSMKGKIVGISIKDRAAILPAGHRATAAYWMDSETGDFVTSSYYMSALPQWVKAFNNKKLAEKYLDQNWKLLLPESEYPEKDDLPFEGKFKGMEKSVFPYDLRKLKKAYGPGIIGNTPWGNNITVDMAIAAMEGEKLGQDEVTDLLAVSFSTPDKMGHQFGPHSREMHDMYLRFDRELGRFLKYIEENIGMENVLIFFTADHGAADVPGFIKSNTGYFSYDEMNQKLQDTFESAFGVDELLIGASNYQLYLDHDLMKENDISLEEMVALTKDALMDEPWIYTVLNAHELSDCQLPGQFCDLVRNGYHPQRGGDIYILPKPGWIDTYYENGGTTHGSPFSYDTHIPMFWMGWKIPKGATWQRTEIPDIAVTIASLLGITDPNGSTGKTMLPLIKED